MSDTRKLIESSLRGSIRRLQLPGAEVPASLAGLCLVFADGDAERAFALAMKIPTETAAEQKFVDAAKTCLATVAAEERAERGPNLKTG